MEQPEYMESDEELSRPEGLLYWLSRSAYFMLFIHFFAAIFFVPILTLGRFGLNSASAPFVFGILFLAATLGSIISRLISWRQMAVIHSLFACIYSIAPATGIFMTMLGDPQGISLVFAYCMVAVPLVFMIVSGTKLSRTPTQLTPE